MKEIYEKQIAESEKKQKLMEIGLRAQIQSSGETLPLDYINDCINLINAEKATKKYYEEQLQELISGEAERKAEAKRKLGIA
ncbi:hypothetical protein IKA92_07330 [bacterium]|nr:hypothetical protein [bacterium]MBR2387088.1 hypothetical protein [bacterium]